MKVPAAESCSLSSATGGIRWYMLVAAVGWSMQSGALCSSSGTGVHHMALPGTAGAASVVIMMI